MSGHGVNSETGGESGDPDSRRAQVLSRLFEDHNRTLVSFLVSRLGNEAEAKEVAQEAYVRILQLDAPGVVGFLRAYLFRTAANIATDRIRHRTRVERFSEVYEGEDLVNNLGPERESCANEALDLLRNAIRELPPRYRRAFLMHRFEDAHASEIGARIGVNERQARNYVQRAVTYCRLRVDGCEREDAMRRVFP